MCWKATGEFLVERRVTRSDSYFTKKDHLAVVWKTDQKGVNVEARRAESYKGDLFPVVVGYYLELLGNIWELR